MKQRWGKIEESDWSWWAVFVMLAVMVVMVIFKVR